MIEQWLQVHGLPFQGAVAEGSSLQGHITASGAVISTGTDFVAHLAALALESSWSSDGCRSTDWRLKLFPSPVAELTDSRFSALRRRQSCCCRSLTEISFSA